MQYRITYPMEVEAFIHAVVEESGQPRDAATVNLAVTIATTINKAYYQGKFGQGQAPAPVDNIARVRRSMERGEIDAQHADFLAQMYYNEAAAFDAGRKERMKHDAI